jgi:hypothetical protein
MPEELDAVARYGMALGFTVRQRTVLVEGNTDVKLFELASIREYEATGIELLGQSLAVVSPGTGDRGGTSGVIRELVSLRANARTCLLSDGRPRYRFVGLFDTDRAGRLAVRTANEIDSSILEYKDVFRLHPVMPADGILHPKALKASFERENAAYKGIEWESEDLLPDAFINEFLSECPGAVRRKVDIGGGKVHRDFTQEGKARFHRFIQDHAILKDLAGVVDVLKALRFYCGLK